MNLNEQMIEFEIDHACTIQEVLSTKIEEKRVKPGKKLAYVLD